MSRNYYDNSVELVCFLSPTPALLLFENFCAYWKDMRLAYVTERFRCSSFVYPMFVILRCSQLQRKKKSWSSYYRWANGNNKPKKHKKWGKIRFGLRNKASLMQWPMYIVSYKKCKVHRPFWKDFIVSEAKYILRQPSGNDYCEFYVMHLIHVHTGDDMSACEHLVSNV